MIPHVILDVILDVILHGIWTCRRSSIRPWERVLGTESIMSKEQPRESPRFHAQYLERLLA
jgi:hypothetical protein